MRCPEPRLRVQTLSATFHLFPASERKALIVASPLIKRAYGDALQVLEPFRKVRPMYGGLAYAPDMIETVRGLNFELDE